MEDDPSVPTPEPEYAEPKKRAPRKKPDLSNVEPAAITIQTKKWCKDLLSTQSA